MFGMVAVSGIRTLGQVDYRNNNNGMVVALTLGLGMLPVMVPQLFQQMPKAAEMFLHSGITIGTVVAIAANLILNGRDRQAKIPGCKECTLQDLDMNSTAAREAFTTTREYIAMRRRQNAQKNAAL